MFTNSSTDNFLSPIPVSYRLIFCCGILIIHQERIENDKNTNFFDKKQQKMPNKYT